MRNASCDRGFTLIELLTVIAIISILAAILFPLAGTVQEQARQSDCMSKMHQLYVGVNVYKEDENGAYPPALLGFAEAADGTPYTGTNLVAGDKVINGYLYQEQVRDYGQFHCPNNFIIDKSVVTIAEFPPKPANWPVGVTYVGDALATACGTGPGGGTIDCFTDGPLAGQPRYYYTWDSYDIGPRINPVTLLPVLAGGAVVYDRHYGLDWTGVRGLDDAPNQLKYKNPPGDRTLLTYCTWHTAVGRSPSVPAIALSGSARKLSLREVVGAGQMVLAR